MGRCNIFKEYFSEQVFNSVKKFEKKTHEFFVKVVLSRLRKFSAKLLFKIENT